MATTADSTKVCPKCGAALDPIAYASGQPFACGGCGARMKKNPQKGEPADTPPASDEAGTGLLEIVEDLLIKMIFGIFRFICVRVPTEVYRAVVRWFPTLVKVLKVCGLSAVWLAIAFGPCLVILQSSQHAIDGWPRYSGPAWYAKHAALWNSLAWIYTALALTGSGWGVLYVRRRRKLAHNAPAAR